MVSEKKILEKAYDNEHLAFNLYIQNVIKLKNVSNWILNCNICLQKNYCKHED